MNKETFEKKYKIKETLKKHETIKIKINIKEK